MIAAHHLPVLQVVLPLVAAPLAVLCPGTRAPWVAAVLVSLAAFAIAVTLAFKVATTGAIAYELGGWPVPYGIGLHIDNFSSLMLLLITGASLAALLHGKPVIDKEVQSRPVSLFYGAWLLAVAGLAGMVVTGDAFNVFVFMEISSLATYVLIAAGPTRTAFSAVFKYIIMGSIGAMFYLIGVGLVYMMTGTLNMADMAARLHGVDDVVPVLAAAGFITVGLLLKAAIFPLHAWMPNAYAAAPSTVAVFLAACSTKVALYVLIRFDLGIFQPSLEGHDIQFSAFLMPFALVAMITGSLIAIFEKDLKRLLAFSSVAQLGYIVLGASLLTAAGMSAGILHLFNHALMKAALFLAVGSLVYRYGSAKLADLAGAGRAMPWTMAAFTVAALSLVGVPLTAGFISKWYLVLAAMEEGTFGWFLIAVILASSLLAVIYVWRVIEVAYFRPAPEGAPAVKEAPWYLLAPTWALAGLNIYFGLAANAPNGLAARAAADLLGGGA
ncbi:monovalent cation/H+ antiporter subunit D family protein [Pseudokordiimonas caeni]|uniref:monovalent cation/H+ antiporter subunit D family protein n=1 Tax=Pseudokordiimonas caeni TaxID=2997908 RepID=UPI002810F2AB|nr:monovalent cation/H+ antiporter subunit D family protein [Pseudokordiimonas caeni]